ncbi:Aminotransferase class I and II [Hespellia stercorisuis DSM 15480]|uniref:cysteine-S-conjugate beta-lyase n=1 Tax=Hespellia stercorisuis DSM 15480 TaxID=1121950 RepID=A0A1M6USZ8_9FIRM|nr:Aminotransferase class I and II [Hespellia stercorisuis DSM 15480]
MIIFADEIHGDLTRRGQEFHPILTLADPENIIAATAVNKTFNLAGLHATNLVIQNPELRKRIELSLPFILPSPFTIAATIAAYDEGEEWLEQLIDYLDGNIDFVIESLREKMPKAKCRRPEGTYILWIDLRDYEMTPEEIHHRIYDEAGVILEGGEMFCENLGKGFERICVPSPRSVLKEAIDRMAAAMNR